MVKYVQMNTLAFLAALMLSASACSAPGVAVPPPSGFVDTEAETNVVFDAGVVVSRTAVLGYGITVR